MIILWIYLLGVIISLIMTRYYRRKYTTNKWLEVMGMVTISSFSWVSVFICILFMMDWKYFWDKMNEEPPKWL